ncbi:hypothetical protein PVAND_010132 [Polypedilum vanderplanki]|uniref:ATPase AAA-type core domain-containing protein n=1 Tax=Polypedilum vanderplanki TaxID=319348 RepID=A0A9J6CGA3_POLVA|nr:hypothetical protein PVAND_010132 [Polypedilum vanderplanki]
MWIATKEDLKNAILRDQVLRHLEPTKNRAQAHELIGNLYARYVILCNNLSELYDQTLQVQRRALIEKLLISSQERLKEIQNDIRKIEMSQFIFVDDALVELNLTTYDIEFLRPFYFPRRRSFECQQVINRASAKVKSIESELIEEPPKGLDRFRKIPTREEREAAHEEARLTFIINEIKRHEKARQGRILEIDLKHMPDKIKLRSTDDDDDDEKVFYEFQHNEDQIGKFKIKRTKFVADLYSKPVNTTQYDYYSPPEFRINRLGKKVLIPKVKKQVEIVEEINTSDEEEKAEAERKLKLLKEEEEVTKFEAIKLHERQNEAALVIQQCFYRYSLRKQIEKRKIARLQTYGMHRKPVNLDLPNIYDPIVEYENKRRERKKEFDEALIKALEDEKARILRLKSESIMEDITEDIREWFREFYKEAKDFHRYPEEFEGGTIMVMYEKTKTPEEFLIEKNKTSKEKAQERKDKRKAKRREKQRKKKEKEREKVLEMKKKQLELKEGVTFDFSNMKEWKAFESLQKTFDEGENDFQFIDELKNSKELPIWEWVTVDAYCDVHKELRLIVDDLMRVELQLLRFALSLDLKKPYVPQKPKKPKKDKKKKKQRKSVVDIFEERSIEECFNELKELNIIRQYEKKSLDEFIGECSYATTDLRALNKDPPLHYGDVKNYIQTEILGSAAQIKSFCIIGPEKCGKKFLVEALCSEMGAVIFDLSAPKIKDITDMSYFLDLVLQVAVKFQPSVLFIDGAHKPYIRKADDEVKLENPWKLGKYLIKDIVKNLANDDAVMLIGVTNQPWNCNFRYLRMCYEKFAIFPPKLDFGTALKAWHTGLELKRIYNFDAISLGEVSRGFSVGDILDSIDKHIDFSRGISLYSNPLTCNELIENLITTKKPIEDKVVKQFNKFVEMLDPYIGLRKGEIERVQEELNKAKEAKEKMKNKKKKS